MPLLIYIVDEAKYIIKIFINKKILFRYNRFHKHLKFRNLKLDI